DVTEMRERIAKQYPTRNPWALKHVRGGMVDMDFIAQYIVLRHAPENPLLWHRSARQVFESAQTDGLLDVEITRPLIEAKKFLSDLISLLRLSAPGGLITDDAPMGLKNLLVKGMRMHSYDALKEHVLRLEHNVTQVYAQMVRGDL
ncbi:MAG: hypothetical protein ACOYNL_09175, partial [Rickettsiales bacterium]